MRALDQGGRVPARYRPQPFSLSPQIIPLRAQRFELGSQPGLLRLERGEQPRLLRVVLGEAPGPALPVLPLLLSAGLGHFRWSVLGNVTNVTNRPESGPQPSP